MIIVEKKGENYFQFSWDPFGIFCNWGKPSRASGTDRGIGFILFEGCRNYNFSSEFKGFIY